MRLLSPRLWPWAILAFATSLFLLLLLTRPKIPKPQKKPKVWHVEAALVQPGRFVPHLKLYGRLVTEALVQKRAPAASEVVEINTSEGHVFKKGEVLLRLDPRDFRPQLTEVEAEIEFLKAEQKRLQTQLQQERALLQREEKLLELRQRALERAKKLLKKKLGSEAIFDQAKESFLRQKIAVSSRALRVKTLALEIDKVAAKLMQMQARHERTQKLLQRSAVVAPFDGVVHRVEVATGESVQPGQFLLSFYNPATLEVKARIPAPFFAELATAFQKGIPLTAEGESLGIPFQAWLDRFAGEVGEAGIDAFFKIVGEKRSLRHNMPTTLWLRRPARDGLIPLPQTALYGRDLIYRIRDGQLEPVVVHVVGRAGHKGGRSWILVESETLRSGDLVLALQLPEAAAGIPVEVRSVLRWD